MARNRHIDTYLIETLNVYTREKLKAYKSLDAYKVQDVTFYDYTSLLLWHRELRCCSARCLKLTSKLNKLSLLNMSITGNASVRT